jgi:2-iminobutanoate/2-iminopropanoate deaminase
MPRTAALFARQLLAAAERDSRSPREATGRTTRAPRAELPETALGPYSQAIVADSFVFCSGTVGIDPASGVPGDGVEAQTELALRNLEAILTAAGASLSALVKTTIFYNNVEDFATINEVYARFMPDPPPARSASANVVLPRGLLISIDAVAALPSA